MIITRAIAQEKTTPWRYTYYLSSWYLSNAASDAPRSKSPRPPFPH